MNRYGLLARCGQRVFLLYLKKFSHHKCFDYTKGKKMPLIFTELNGRCCRTYLVYDDVSREAMLIDPIFELVENYLEMLDKTNLQLVNTIDTHTHADHVSGSVLLKEETGCDYMMHRSSKVSSLTSRLDEGQCSFGGKIMHTPGHTKDSMSIVFPDCVFVGDLLFLDEGGAGRLDLPGGDAGEHWDSLQRILGLPEDLIMYPAHDYRGCVPTSIGVQKTRNQFLVPRSKVEYLAFTKNLRYGPAEWMKDVLRLNEECIIPNLRAYSVPAAGNACENICESTSADASRSIPHISVQEFNAQLNAPYDRKSVPILLDVREADELIGDLPALPGIIHIPVGSIADRINELDIVKEKNIIVICRSGKRALAAAITLTDAGFSRISVLSGGMLAYVAEKE